MNPDTEFDRMFADHQKSFKQTEAIIDAGRERMVKASKYAFIVGLFFATLWLCLGGAVAYVAWHFISKLW